jgi:hypothetical protein
MKKQAVQPVAQPPFVILRDQRRADIPRVPLRLLQTSRPTEVTESDDSLVPEPLSFGYTTFRQDSYELLEEEGQCQRMKRIPSPSHQILINYEEFD